MPAKMARSAPSAAVRRANGGGAASPYCQNAATAQKSTLSSGFIWRIPDSKYLCSTLFSCVTINYKSVGRYETR
jgi:hypothetical protein